ncbi:MAG: polysaccharide deacetylase family protein [Bacteroidota bacterium]
MSIKTITTTVIFILVLFQAGFAQDQQPAMWNHRQFAVALTYDDGLNVHLDKVVPVLDSLGFKATFYIPCNSSSLTNRLAEWKALADHGHELGNHSVFHPCAGKSKGRAWVKTAYDLDRYNLSQMIDEIRLANTFLRAIDGRTRRTFAYTCGDMAIGDSSFVDSIKNDFVAARGVTSGMNLLKKTDLRDIRTYTVDGQRAEELMALVDQAKKEHALLVFLFHGVGGEHAINIALAEHNKLMRYLKENETEAWIAPLVEIAAYMSRFNQNPAEKQEVPVSK